MRAFGSKDLNILPLKLRHFFLLKTSNIFKAGNSLSFPLSWIFFHMYFEVSFPKSDVTDFFLAPSGGNKYNYIRWLLAAWQDGPLI